MRIYLAGPYAARAQLKAYATELEQIGCNVTASWLDETSEISPGTVAAASDLDDATVNLHARTDLGDIDKAELFIVFTQALVDPGGAILGGSSGGRHVETGYAIGTDVPVIVVGEPENLFHRMRQVTVCPDWHDTLIEVAARLVRNERQMDRAMPG